MTTAVLRGTPSLSVPPTQNTAPVIEFNCLYTHDIRRKQKRWQDGFLRFHTFNKRVMVYDVPRNFLGDIHWTQNSLQEGDEMTLEKGGIVVQVNEEVGRTETDLSELLQRKEKPSPAKNTSSTPYPSAKARQTHTPRAQSAVVGSHVKHKSLNSLLGTPRGPIGKVAYPTKSPYESRKEQENEEWGSTREPKRQKIDTRNVTRTTNMHRASTVNPLSIKQDKSAAVSSTSSKRIDRHQQTLGLKEVIDLSSDTEIAPRADDDIHSDERTFLTSSAAPKTAQTPILVSKGPETSKRKLLMAPDTPQPTVNDSPSACRLQRKQPRAGTAQYSVTESVAESSNGMRAARARLSGSMAVQKPPSTDTDKLVPRTEKIQQDPLFASNRDSQRSGQTLKLVGSAPRKLLVFQSQSSKRANSGTRQEEPGSPNLAGAENIETEARRKKEAKAASKPVAESDFQSIHRQRLQERLARIGKKQQSVPVASSSFDETNQPALERIARDDTRVGPLLPRNRAVAEPQANSTSINNGDEARRTSPPVVRKTIIPPPSDGPPGKARARASGPELPESAKQAPVPPVENRSRTMPPPLPRPIVLTRPLPTKQRSTVNTLPPAAPSSHSHRSNETKAVLDVTKDVPDVGPWSSEAFDLMDWRPPDRGNAKTSNSKAH